MKTNTVARRLVFSLLAATTVLAASPLLAQEPGRPATVMAREPLRAGVEIPTCPAPMNLTLHATSPNVFPGDFTAGELAGVVWLGDSHPNRHFVYTFQWKPAHRCCQITKAVLTVAMQADQGGQSTSSPDAGNDNIVVTHLGSIVPPYNERVYTGLWPFQAGQQVTKVWNLNADLANINAENRLSFYVEDDTMVKSAMLQLTGCCLSGNPTALDYETKSQCEAQEKRNCVQISNGTWHAQ